MKLSHHYKCIKDYWFTHLFNGFLSWHPVEAKYRQLKLILSLFRKQEDKSSKSRIKSELHRKKDRQRNLLPAKTGILILVMTLLATLVYFASYGLHLDVYTRTYYLGFVNDLFPCFLSPIIVVFEAPVIRRKINKSFLMYKSHFYEKLKGCSWNSSKFPKFFGLKLF